MAKTQTRFVCQNCGEASPRWLGQCPHCHSWNTLSEEIVLPKAKTPQAAAARGATGTLAFAPISARPEAVARMPVGIAELDRVLGGGLVPGAAVLLGGEPGVGKSTLLLQAADRLARQGRPVFYVSGEESEQQIRLRAARLGLGDSAVRLASGNDAAAVAMAIFAAGDGSVAIVDSIQTMSVSSLDSAPGSVAQIRASTDQIVRAAKAQEIPVVLVGHVTKEGGLAGPKVLEHAVDAVLLFEGDRGLSHRLIRAVKNRYGATDEVGVFEMGEQGLREVANPSALFLSDGRGEVAGSAVFPAIEGTRPLLVEVQALVNPVQGTPRRAVVGWDGARLAMILAVLEARCGVMLGDKDVYLNVVGGLRIAEPAADLAAAAAIASAAIGIPLPATSVAFGEIGLAGEIRPVGQMELRLREAAKLGFTSATCAPPRGPTPRGIQVDPIRRLDMLVHALLRKAREAKGRG
jgi:DNA repair protein RadA/Sms